jgi:hypothetical protein
MAELNISTEHLRNFAILKYPSCFNLASLYIFVPWNKTHFFSGTLSNEGKFKNLKIYSFHLPALFWKLDILNFVKKRWHFKQTK